MLKNIPPKELAIDLLARSVCSVQVAAVIYDSYGIFSWGWNSLGPDGFGWHAEAHAISRANRQRLAGSTIAVASRRKKSGSIICSKPCDICMKRIIKAQLGIIYLDRGDWKYIHDHLNG